MSWGGPKCRHRSQQFMYCCDSWLPWKFCLSGCCLDTDLGKLWEVPMEGSHKLIRIWTRDLPVCSIVPQRSTLLRAPEIGWFFGLSSPEVRIGASSPECNSHGTGLHAGTENCDRMKSRAYSPTCVYGCSTSFGNLNIISRCSNTRCINEDFQWIKNLDKGPQIEIYGRVLPAVNTQYSSAVYCSIHEVIAFSWCTLSPLTFPATYNEHWLALSWYKIQWKVLHVAPVPVNVCYR
jgi:hypothetical protein